MSGITCDAPHCKTGLTLNSTYDHHQRVAIELRSDDQAAQGFFIESRSAGEVFGVRVTLVSIQQTPLVSLFDIEMGGNGVGAILIPRALVGGIRARGLGHAEMYGIEHAEQLAAVSVAQGPVSAN